MKAPFALLALALLAACGEETGGDAPAARNEALVQAFAQAMNARDWAALDTLLAEDYVRHSQATPAYDVRSREDFLRFAREDAEAFPDARLAIERLVSEGDEVAFWGTYRGTQEGPMGIFPPTGGEVALDFAGIHRLAGGRIAETWVTWDNLAALVQLGHWDVRPARERPDAFCAVWLPAAPE